MSTNAMIAATAIPTSTWYYMMKNPEEITIKQLLAIANGLHIPVRRLFYTGRTYTIGKREDYITDDFMPCSYDGKVLQRIVSTRPDATWEKASKATGVTPTNLRNSLTSKTTTAVTRLLVVCEAFDIDPFTILIDPNPLYDNKKENAIATSGEYETILAKIAALQHEMANHKALLEDIRHAIAELSKKPNAVAGDNEVQLIARRKKRVASEASKIA